MAQISVTATVGTTGPTTYTTLKAAFDAINLGTHKGVINISITGNTTETAKDSLSASGVGGASYTAIKIKPATSATPTITGTVANYLIELSGASNVTIDGSNTVNGTTKDLTIQNLATNGATILLDKSATGDTLRNTVFKGASSNGPVVWIGFAGTGNGVSNNVIQNNDITKSTGGTPFMGIWNLGTSGKPNSGNIIRGNRIFDFKAFGFIDGGSGNDSYGFSNNTLVEGNEFYHTAAITSGDITGIYLDNSVSISNMTISKNYFHDMNSSSTSNYVAAMDLYEATSVNVINNMIVMSGVSAQQVGIIQETSPGATIKVQYNTISISGTNATNESFAYVKAYTSTGDDVRNNIFVNTRTSTTDSQFVIGNFTSVTMVSNYNDLVTTSNPKSFVGANATGVFATLANWQTASAGDANSISVAPVFTSATNLHLNPASNPTLDNKGTPIAGITTDYDGDTRSTTTPDMGLDEFTSTSTCTNPVITAQPTAQTICVGGNISFSVTATGTGLTYQWRKGGSNITGATSATYTKTGAVAGDAGNYDVVVSSGACSVTSNAVALTVNTGLTITTQPTPRSACLNSSTTFNVIVSPSTGVTYQWRKNGVNVTTGSGGTTASYTLSGITSADAGNYDVVITGGTCGNVTSNTAALTFSGPCTAVPDVNAEITSVVMTPNVVRDHANVHVTATKAMKLNWTIVDAQGKVVMTLSSQVAPGKNDITLYVGQLSNGTYQLKGATAKGLTNVIRFVKM